MRFSGRRRRLLRLASGFAAWVASSDSAWAAGAASTPSSHPDAGADLLLQGGRVVRFGAGAGAGLSPTPAQALAIRDGRIVAVGSTDALQAWRSARTRVIDLGGRTVIPGLIDSHMHAIRAGLTFGSEVDWTGARSIAEALARLQTAACARPAGSWLVVAGGWIESQFAERRLPTQAELARAAPDHPVYIQRLYDSVLFSPGAFERLGVLQRPELASRLRVQTDAQDRPTGWYGGDPRTVSDLYDLLPVPDRAAQLAGTQAFFRQLNGFGVTGVIDPGGYNLPLSAYEPVFELSRREGLSLRVAYSLCAPRRDHEFEDFRQLTALLPMGATQGLLRFNGLGENVVWGMYNNDSPSEPSRERMREVLRWAARRGLSVTFHWNNDRSVDHLLRILEELSISENLRPLRWSIAHLNDASASTLARMRALGLGWLAQDAMYFRGDEVLGGDARDGRQSAPLWPPIAEALSLGLPVGLGTDAHRVMSYNPFVALQWLLDGKTVGGRVTRPAGSRVLSRLEALRLFTEGSAWFAHDETERGALEPGRLADLAVLDGDYLDGPLERIGQLRSLLTLVGGRVVHAQGEFAGV